jgi:hypothetical protein
MYIYWSIFNIEVILTLSPTTMSAVVVFSAEGCNMFSEVQPRQILRE